MTLLRQAQERQETFTIHLTYRLDYTVGHQGAAVVVRSGIGDGFYPVYAWVDDLVHDQETFSCIVRGDSY